MVPFFQTAIKKLYFVFGVPFQDGRTISQLPGIIGENIVVFSAVGPATGGVDHGIPVGVNSNRITNGYFHRFPLTGNTIFLF